MRFAASRQRVWGPAAEQGTRVQGRTNSVDSSMTASPSSIMVSAGACESVRRLLLQSALCALAVADAPPQPREAKDCHESSCGLYSRRLCAAQGRHSEAG